VRSSLQQARATRPRRLISLLGLLVRERLETNSKFFIYTPY
jgi:hypothetical protein